MSKLSIRLHTRGSGLEKTIVLLDITPKDYERAPLQLYAAHSFFDVDAFINYATTTTDTSIVLIVSNLLADIAIHILRPLLPQIFYIYILGPHLRFYQIDKYIKQRYLDVDSMLHVIFDNLGSNVITHKSYSTERSVNDLTTNPAKYIWYQFFFDILSNLKYTNIARNEMLTIVRAFHSSKNRNIVLRNCKKFEESYRSEDIIIWYARFKFFHIALNRSLRSENINQMFPFRYILSDLKRFINELQTKQSLTDYKFIYRGQQMYFDELKSIGYEIDHVIGTTTFWPATSSFDKAYHTALSPMRCVKSLEPVVFIIDVSYNLHHHTFVDLSHLDSYNRVEKFIFPPGSIFRIKGINQLYDVWYINLVSIDETDDEFVQIKNLWSTTIGPRNFCSLSSNEAHHYFRDLSEANTAFLRFQLLADIILRLDHNDFAKNEMLEICKEKFVSNPNELTKIEIFEKTYMPKNAITWYTKDCFLYRLLNESLQSENIDLIVKLRYFIHDLHNQLTELHSNYLRYLLPNQLILKLYRGLRMTLNDLEKFRQNEDNLVSTNSFLSTTRDYQAALFFAGEGKIEDPEVSVIYEITVDTTIPHSVPFAEIEYKSIYLDEDEVLFSMAAVFRVGKTKRKEDHLWHIELTLTPPTEEHWNILTAHLKK